MLIEDQSQETAVTAAEIENTLHPSRECIEKYLLRNPSMGNLACEVIVDPLFI
jgi:hypothetical protein